MKTLKRILCLVLSMAMVLGMVVVAHAADTDYPEAVAVLNGVKAFVGDTTGNLDLQGTFTREQAAKLVTYLLVGPKKADALKGENTFSDVKADSWAAGYISYCYNNKIINGFDDHLFHATENVTGYQLGKMLVCCLGYDMEKEEISGPYWDARIAALMYANGLMDGLDIELGKDLTREEAAQLCFNALKATVLKYTEEGGLFPVDNYAVVETIYNDNKLQLGEKLYPTLVLVNTKTNHIWKFNGESLGIYDNPVVTEEEDLSEYHALFGFKKLVLNRRVLNTFEPLMRLNAYGTGAVAPTGDRGYQITETLRAIAQEAEENTVLFSKELVGVYSPVLFAKAGEEIFVKANWMSLERANNAVALANDIAKYVSERVHSTGEDSLGEHYFGDEYVYDKLPTKLRSTTSTEVDLEKLVNTNFAAALVKDVVNEPYHNAYANIEPADGTDHSYEISKLMFGKDALNFVDELARLGLMTALKENGLEGIDLELVTPAMGDIPAVYKFVMPDRMVTGWDFQQVETHKVTFTLGDRTRTLFANVSPLGSPIKSYIAGLLIVQTGEANKPEIKLVTKYTPATIYADEDEVVRYSFIPFVTSRRTDVVGESANGYRAGINVTVDDIVSEWFKRELEEKGINLSNEVEIFKPYISGVGNVDKIKEFIKRLFSDDPGANKVMPWADSADLSLMYTIYNINTDIVVDLTRLDN